MLPKYMEPGTDGSASVVVLTFLASWAAVEGIKVPEGFRVDQVYGDRGAILMGEFQKRNGLDSDGGCGPRTRAVMDEVPGFNFEVAVRAVGGVTKFVQPDGSVVTWSPEIEATEMSGHHTVECLSKGGK